VTLYVLGNLSTPELIAAEMVEDLQAALDQSAQSQHPSGRRTL
jgi:hypothetical protein